MGLFHSLLKAVPVVGNIISASDSKKATKKASAAQQAAINTAIGGINDQYNTDAARYTPYTTAGTDALGGLRDALGLNGSDAQSTFITNTKASPLYDALFSNGRDAILSSASATGGLRGGNVNTSLANFGRDTLASVIQDQISKLGGLSSQGLGATENLAALGADRANSVGNLQIGIGNSQAGSILNRQAIDNNLFSGLRQTVAAAVTGGLGAGVGAGGAGLGSILGTGNFDITSDSPANGGIAGNMGGGSFNLGNALKSLLGGGGF